LIRNDSAQKIVADEVDRAGSSFTADPKKKAEIYELSEPDGWWSMMCHR
jgi:hypothetical protein